MRTPTAKCSTQKAFTLLEIMVALVIVGTAMVALLSLGNRSIGIHDHLQRLTQATLLAQQKMAESEFEAQRSGVGQMVNSGGAFNDPFSDYRWRVAISNTPLPAVQMVTVTVVWGDEERNEGVDVTSFLF